MECQSVRWWMPSCSLLHDVHAPSGARERADRWGHQRIPPMMPRLKRQEDVKDGILAHPLGINTDSRDHGMTDGAKESLSSIHFLGEGGILGKEGQCHVVEDGKDSGEHETGKGKEE